MPKESIKDWYLVDRELGYDEFDVTYLCIDRHTRELLACKSISKRKLHTAIDVEDVRHDILQDSVERHLDILAAIGAVVDLDVCLPT